MTLQEVRDKANSLSSSHKRRISRLVVRLLDAAESKDNKRCAVCGLESLANTAHFVVPVNYVATCLVRNDLDKEYGNLSFRTAFLCPNHGTHFDALFVDVAETKWSLGRLERRTEILGGEMTEDLLVFGGSKAVRIAQEFQASVAALKRSVQEMEN